jgi:hypothetical protein
MIILIILWTISFITIQGFAADARDAKRITDITNILEKVNIEQTKWTLLSELVIDTFPHPVIINWTWNISHQWETNFINLKEDWDSFKDPSNSTINYPIAWATTETDRTNQYNFLQIATISEKSKSTIIRWNYYKMNPETDVASLFLIKISDWEWWVKEVIPWSDWWDGTGDWTDNWNDIPIYDPSNPWWMQDWEIVIIPDYKYTSPNDWYEYDFWDIELIYNWWSKEITSQKEEIENWEKEITIEVKLWEDGKTVEVIEIKEEVITCIIWYYSQDGNTCIKTEAWYYSPEW